MRLCAENLSLERGGRRLFAKLSFEVNDGEALIVHGSNGAGKSSLLRAIAGFLPFSNGCLRHEGGDTEAKLGEQTHYLGHTDSLRSALTVRENLEFWANLQGGEAGRVASALRDLGLSHVHDFPTRALSAGQKRRVALSRLLLSNKAIWLLDEPTTSLDGGSRALLAEIMRGYLSRGGLIVVATHASLGISATQQIQLDAKDFSPVGE